MNKDKGVDAPYGYCPVVGCGAMITARSRSMDGLDICERGHEVPKQPSGNPLDRWPVQVCGKCGGRVCQACGTEPKLQALMTALEQQLAVITGLTSAVGQLTNRLLEVERYVKDLEETG